MGPDVKMNAYVPMDDDHTLQWEVSYRTDGPAVPQRFSELNSTSEPKDSGRGGRYMPQGTGWYERWVLEQNLENDYFVDREAQAKWESYSGIPGTRQQDMAVTETMGPIYNRSREHLGNLRLDDHPHPPPLDRRCEGFPRPGRPAPERR